jgi:hypothetical protein
MCASAAGAAEAHSQGERESLMLDLGMLGSIRGAGKTAAMAVVGLLVALVLSSAGAHAAVPPPLIEGVHAREVGTTSATLEAKINPEGVVSRYRFEYGPQDCSLVSSCTKVPKVEGKIEAGGSPVAVEVKLEGLDPATLYHFRLVAKNSGGETPSPDRVFATLGQVLEGLPDGRVYEQASPIDKDGGDAEFQQSLVKATPTGDGVTFASTFGMPRGQGAGALPTFLATRGNSNWSSEGLLPPPGAGERTQVVGWSPDYARIYSRATKLGTPTVTGLVEQSSEGGPLTVIGPYAVEPHYAYVGEAPDGSVVLFEARVKLPPKAGEPPIAAATEGAPNLYAWDAAAGEVHLAGTFNEGAPKGSIAGPYDWSLGAGNFNLTEGGGSRSYYLRDTHVVTPQGDVYFTAAGTGQVYLRRNLTEAQSPVNGEGKCTSSALACTVHVSASQKTNGKGPGGTDPAGEQPAAFQVASKDGSQVFFTSPEKLTNDANTGPEQPQAAIARANSGTGTVEGKEFVLGRAAGVIRFGPWLYWADPRAGTIGRVKLNGEEEVEGTAEPEFIRVPPSEGECEEEVKPGEFKPIEGPIPAEPRYLAVDAEHVYWTNTGRRDEIGEPLDGGGTIGRARLNGEVAEEIEPAFICGEEASQPNKRLVSNPQGIAVDAGHIYWADAAQNQIFRAIARAAIDGNEVKEDFISPVGEFTPYGVTLSSTHIYFDVNDELNSFGYLEWAALDGKEAKGSFVGEAGLRGLAIDSGHVYWATQGEGGWIGRADPNLENKENKFIDVEGVPTGIAAGEAGHLFWSVNGEAPGNPGNDLYRYEPAGDTLTDLAPFAGGNGGEVQGVLGVSEDGSYVYFVADGVLAAGATQGDCKGSVHTAAGKCNLYLWHEGQVSFIGRLNANGGVETDALDWVGTPLEALNTSSYFPRTAFLGKGGTVLVFRSQEQLSAYDNEGVPEFYRYQAGGAGELSCITCRPSGEAPGGGPSSGTNTSFPQIQPGNDVQAIASRNLSADGRRFFFETPEALSPLDTNGEGGCPFQAEHFSCTDVYEWEAPETPRCQESSPSYSPINEGCIYLISTGKSPFPSYFGDASEDGSNVFFFTRQQLVGQDEDELQDVYDARVNGGLPGQNEVKPPPCESTEACRGPGEAPPAEGQAATPQFVGPGNPVPKHKKQKAKKKKKHTKSKHKQNKQRRAKVE